MVTTTLGCGAVDSAPNAALVDAGMDLPSSIMAPANWRGSSGDECPRSARSPARLADDASGLGRIVGSAPPSTLVQVTGALAISAAFVAAAANTTGVVAIGSPTSTSGAVCPSDAAVAVMRSTQTLDSGTHASASTPPDATTAAVSAESCGLITVSTQVSDASSKSFAMSASAGAMEVSAITTSCSLSRHPDSAAANSGFRWPPTQRNTPDADDADDRERGDDGKYERAPRLLRRGLDGMTPHGHSKPDGTVSPSNPCAERVPPFRGRVHSA